jgi:phosphoribosylamine-glycine ligase
MKDPRHRLRRARACAGLAPGAGARLQKVYVAPGNAGTAREQELENLPLTDIQALADYAQREKVHATVVGPEAPLAAGIVDVFRARNLRIFGPTRPPPSWKARRTSPSAS